MRAPYFADDSVSLERAAQRRLKAAIEEMQSAIAQVNQDSALVTINTRAWDDFLADEIPSDAVWDEKIGDARRGW